MTKYRMPTEKVLALAQQQLADSQAQVRALQAEISRLQIQIAEEQQQDDPQDCSCYELPDGRQYTCPACCRKLSIDKPLDF